MSLAFQREVINNIIPRVSPDLIHCNDWMTGLIPAMARQAGHPLPVYHSQHPHRQDAPGRTSKTAASMRPISGSISIYENMAPDYEAARNTNPVDFLASGVFAAHFVNTVSPTFFMRLSRAGTHFVEPAPATGTDPTS